MVDKIKTLVVEDDPIWADKVVKALTNPEFDIIVAINLAQALEIIMNNKIDFIILDLILPDSNATNTLDLITSAAIDVPIVVNTTIQNDNMMQKALLFGVQDFIIKNEFTIEIFIHASKLSVARMVAKLEITKSKKIDDILNNLKLLQIKLDTISK